MRVLVAGFQHETNTFGPSRATYADFVQGGMFPRLVRGNDILSLRDTNIPMGGFLRGVDRVGLDLLPVIWAGATPSAHVEAEAFERISGEILAAARAHTVDAVYLDLHGAMMCEHLDDGEGELLQRLRGLLGAHVPIVASLDLHANVTRQMLDCADALVAYRTYPHEDMAVTGGRAANLLRALLAGGRLHAASRKLPFLIPINGMCTSLEPASRVYRRLETLEASEGLTLNFAPGFPAADFPECGGCVWGYGPDPGAVGRAVETLTAEIVSCEAEWVVLFLPPEEAVREALRISGRGGKPVVIADTQDNPGAGGNSDTTGLLRALLRCGAPDAALGLMVDPDAARIAHEAGVGSEVRLALGGKSGTVGDHPFEGTFRVEQLSDGRCRFGGPMLTGKNADVGPSARLSIEGVEIAVCSYKDQLIDRNLFRMVGVEPERKRVLVVKSSVHFRADFEPMAEAILIAKSAGPMLANPADFQWTRLGAGIRTKPLGRAMSED